MAQKMNLTIKPISNFKAEDDAEVLYKAMKVLGTNEDDLIKILCTRSLAQRMQIIEAFTKLYAMNLVEYIKSETSGDFEKLLVALLMKTEDLLCRDINDALISKTKNLEVVIDALCLKSDAEIRLIDQTYKNLYGKSLAQHLRNEVSGHIGALLVNIVDGKRKDSVIANSAQNIATALIKALKNSPIDQARIVEIFSTNSFKNIKIIAAKYESLAGTTLRKDIEKYLSGDLKDALITILSTENQATHFAHRLYKSMKGIGTNDSALIRICVTRSEIDMVDIKKEFEALYKSSLKSFINEDTSGDYKKGLLTLCGFM